MNKNTPQTSPLDSRQVKNNAGGFVYQTDKWKQFERFLILGSENGSYYSSEQELSVENAENVIDCIKADGNAVLSLINEISSTGRAAKNNPAIFALALVAANGNPEVKKNSYTLIPAVCRTSTHLFTFCEYVQDLRGWSSGLRKGVSKWYTSQTNDKLSYQLVKYRQRDGWTHRDVLRLSHAKAVSTEQNSLFGWTVGKNEAPNQITQAYETLKTTTKVSAACKIIEKNNMPWETVPTELLKEKAIWNSLLATLPLTALVRNLGRMTAIGLFESNLDLHTKLVVSKLKDKENIKRSKLHPITILNAMKVYEQGHGEKGNLSWEPVSKIVEALDDAFYLAFDNVQSTGKNILCAVDCSGSMTGSNIAGMALNAREAAGAMALILASKEDNCEVIGFTDKLEKLVITKRDTYKTVMNKLEKISGGTNCSIAMNYATEKKIMVDSFIILSDNETWTGSNHPMQALRTYRRTINQNAKLVGVGMIANQFEINDPKDMNTMSVVGFDTATPSLINNFIKE